jgi:hypothetical protein
MELTFCILLPIALILGIPLVFGAAVLYQWVSSIECKKRRAILQNTYKVGLVCVLVFGGYMAFTNVSVVGCDKKDSISRFIQKDDTRLAGLSCPCGCGKHK